MKPTILDVAKYILHKMGETVTWKLHKLCYFSQVWYLVWEDEPLFNEYFEAWRNGPVCNELYDTHKGMLSITEKSMPDWNMNNSLPKKLDDDEIPF